MFTGIITDVGRVLEIADGDGRRMTIGTRLPLAEIPLGGSIGTSGICFTAVDKGADWFTVEASGATLEVTTAGAWGVGDTVNLERSLRIGDEVLTSGGFYAVVRDIRTTDSGPMEIDLEAAPGVMLRAAPQAVEQVTKRAAEVEPKAGEPAADELTEAAEALTYAGERDMASRALSRIAEGG